MSRYSTVLMKRRKRMLWLFMGFLAAFAVGILLMPIGSMYKEKNVLLMYLPGTAFWVGMIGTIYMTIKINRSRKSSSRFNEQFGDQKQFGLIRFFQNTEAMIADIIMIVSMIGIVIAEICACPLLVTFVFLAVFVFTFGMHCMLNGINYKYLKYNVRRDEES